MALTSDPDRCPACGAPASGAAWSGGLCPSCVDRLRIEGGATATLPTSAVTNEATVGAIAAGDLLGDRYRVRELLGHGGMGEVWRAFDVKLRVDVALKAVRDSLVRSSRALEALRDEVRAAREVVSPNVCRVFDLVEADGREFVSMEYVDGSTLGAVLRARSPLPLDEAQAMAAQLLAGLDAIHRAGLVHRDVKPENVMCTRTGRVVVMDLGVARAVAADPRSTISGTPAYIAPEQARGAAPDPRADIFSAGIVLAEMVAPGGVRDRGSREQLWDAVRQLSPVVDDTPWAPVLRRALSADPDARPSSAAALARALEELGRRNVGEEGLRPYPGLASFTSEDAAYFFGRELEVEELWKKLRRPHLLALIGPSGAGKSSFIRAGLAPAAPEGWRVVVTTPGTRPFTALADALLPDLRGEEAAIRDLLHVEQIDVAVPLVQRWRRRHAACLLVVDQFEELFTQNTTEVQATFAQLLARLALDADVHVLLSLRDDFLFHCAEFPLSPVFADVTPLQPPAGAALRRALVQPALKCGYRFEDEAIIEELLAQVAGERGALPLVAFAMAALWERRDREHGLLTRGAYAEIGGVSGALAQHAEATLERIGPARLPIVRELCRNLVTASGTRAAMARDDLLSVFPPSERGAAGAVLDALIDARLLTSFEEARGDTGAAIHRVEFVHESLLAHWPRLVQWQAQDAEGAVLRDQLRQAAHLWRERGHADDLLWTGQSYRAFQLWRERYPGALTEAEQAFTEAMEARARRQHRRRQLAVSAVVLAAVFVAAVTSVLWRRSEQARAVAITEAARAEANKLLALGRVELDRDPGRALAYTLASLEIVDTPVARRFAVEALWHGPPERVLDPGFDIRDSLWIDPSDDGRWFAQGGQGRTVFVWSRAGGPPVRLENHDGADHNVQFVAGSRVLVTRTPTRIRIWKAPEWREAHVIPFKGDFPPGVVDDRLFTFSEPTAGSGQVWVDVWSLEGVHIEGPARWSLPWFFEAVAQGRLAFDRAGALIYARGTGVFVRDLSGSSPGLERRLGAHETAVARLTVNVSGTHVASTDVSGNVRVWSTAGSSRVRDVYADLPLGLGQAIDLDARAKRLVTTAKGPIANVWDLDAPAGVLPLGLNAQREFTWAVRFSGDGRWAAALGRVLTLWPLLDVYPRVFRQPSAAMPNSLAFDALGRWLAVASPDGVVQLWPMVDSPREPVRLLSGLSNLCCSVRFVPRSNRLLVGDAGRVQLVPLDGGPPHELPAPDGDLFGFVNLAVSPDGRFAAAGGGASAPGRQSIPVWDLSTETLATTLRPPLDGPPDGTIYQDNVTSMAFAADGRRLLTTGQAGVRLWDLTRRTGTLLYRQNNDWSWGVGVTANGKVIAMRGDQNTNQGSLWWCEIADCRWAGLPWSRRTGTPAFDQAAKTIVTTTPEGAVLVGSLSSPEPHLLYGHVGQVLGLAVSPDSRWIASSDTSGFVRVWRMPDRSRPPFQTLPYEQILARLRSFTNLRAAKDASSPTGYSIKVGENIGWEDVPEW